MKILRIDGWDGTTLGGAEIYIDRVSRVLEGRGHPNLTAVIVTDPPTTALQSARVYRVPRSPARQAVEGFTEGARLVQWLDGLAAEFRPDVIHLHHFRAGFPALAPWLGARPEPIVFTAHDVELVCPIATLTLPDGSACPGGILPRCQFTGCDVGLGLPLNLAERYYFDRYVKDRIRAYICVSHATRRIFENQGYRPTELLRPMIPVAAQPATVPDGPFTFGFLGRYDREKGIDVLIRAIEIVHRSRPDVRVRFAGSGPFPIPSGPEFIDDGWIPNSSPWFSRVHALVVPSRGWENLGNSPIEALGHGLPVIVSDSGGLPETVGEFGTVTRQGNAEDLARALDHVIAHYDDERRRALTGREWVQQEYSIEHHLARLLEIYEAAIAGRNAAPPAVPVASAAPA
jgi:glycosyltransferase involved in cell wall biosynthesis